MFKTQEVLSIVLFGGRFSCTALGYFGLSSYSVLATLRLANPAAVTGSNQSGQQQKAARTGFWHPHDDSLVFVSFVLLCRVIDVIGSLARPAAIGDGAA